MTEESVFLISEIWLNPNKFEEFKTYRISMLDLLEKFNPEFIYHGHPFAWVSGASNEGLPTGIEICRFETEEVAKQALETLEKSGLSGEGAGLVEKKRSYLARYARSVGSGV